MMIDGDVGGGGDDDDNDKDYNGYLMDIFPNCSEVPLRATNKTNIRTAKMWS